MGRNPPHVVPPAQGLVPHQASGFHVAPAGSDVTYHHLFAFHHHDAVDCPGVLGSTAAAPAESLYLQDLDPVGKLDQPLGPGKQLGPEIGGDAERA